MTENLFLKKKKHVEAAKDHLIKALALLVDPRNENMAEAAWHVMLTLFDIRDADIENKSYQLIVDELEKLKKKDTSL